MLLFPYTVWKVSKQQIAFGGTSRPWPVQGAAAIPQFPDLRYTSSPQFWLCASAHLLLSDPGWSPVIGKCTSFLLRKALLTAWTQICVCVMWVTEKERCLQFPILSTACGRWGQGQHCNHPAAIAAKPSTTRSPFGFMRPRPQKCCRRDPSHWLSKLNECPWGHMWASWPQRSWSSKLPLKGELINNNKKSNSFVIHVQVS